MEFKQNVNHSLQPLIYMREQDTKQR